MSGENPFANEKSGRDTTGTPSSVKKVRSRAKTSADGRNNRAFHEPVPHLHRSGCQDVWEGAHNATITLGRDQPSTSASGYGGLGHHGAGAIDICVGRMSYAPREVDDKDEKIQVYNNFISDAARIYISQKTDIDKNFNLRSGSTGNTNTRSGIGIKADHVRVMAREAIKIVTLGETKNSQDGMIVERRGIDLIAGNDDSDMQPIAKANNVAYALDTLLAMINDIQGILHGILMTQTQFNAIIGTHTHPVDWLGMKGTWTSPSLEAAQGAAACILDHNLVGMVDTALCQANLESYRGNFLLRSGPDYIGSRRNYTN